MKNKYPLPLMNSAFESLQGATVFSKLDLRNAYHLVRIHEGDEWKTAFNTPLWQFEYLLMPFGLTNAPAVFQCLINDVLRDILGRFVFVYLDDILFFSQNQAEHIQHVHQVLQRLLENCLFVKAEKVSQTHPVSLWLRWTPQMWVSEPSCPSDPQRIRSFTHMPFCSIIYLPQKETMMSETANFWQLNWHSRSGDTGWRARSSLLWSGLTTKTSSTSVLRSALALVKPDGPCFLVSSSLLSPTGPALGTPNPMLCPVCLRGRR